MSIISKPPETVKREYDIQEPVAQAVENYAMFIQSSLDHVVNSDVKMAIWKDAEFPRWRTQEQTNVECSGSTVSIKAAKA